MLGMDTSSEEDLVRAGYDALSHRYRGDDDSAEEYGPWLADLQTHLPDRGDVLDIGCGCGLPVARCLAAAGHRVTGVDISDVQIGRARRLVPDATFIRADAAQLRFSPGSFDAIVCLYALIHMPLDQQPRLLRSIAEWLRPGGWLLATTGQDAWTGTQDNWLGGPATMWWSHADAATSGCRATAATPAVPAMGCHRIQGGRPSCGKVIFSLDLAHDGGHVLCSLTIAAACPDRRHGCT